MKIAKNVRKEIAKKKFTIISEETIG